MARASEFSVAIWPEPNMMDDPKDGIPLATKVIGWLVGATGLWLVIRDVVKSLVVPNRVFLDRITELETQNGTLQDECERRVKAHRDRAHDLANLVMTLQRHLLSLGYECDEETKKLSRIHMEDE